MTYNLIQDKNHDQLAHDSPSTIAKASGKTSFSASTAIAINNQAWYFPYKTIASILITGLQCLNPSIEGPKAQNTR